MINLENLSAHGLNLPKALGKLPYQLGIKNSHFEYVWCNDITAKLVGFQKGSELIGKTDYDLKCPAVENAPNIQALDQQILQKNEPFECYAVDEYSDGSIILKANVIPFTSPVTNESYLFIMTQEYHNNLIKKLIQHQSKRFGSKSLLSDQPIERVSDKLSQKQYEIIFYLLRGYRSKAIAKQINLSPRTVDWHIEKMKEALECSSRAELITLALAHGWENIIPRSLFQLNTQLLWS